VHLTGQNAVPDLYGSAYFAANRRGGTFEPVRHSIDRAAFGAVIKKVCDLAPRAVIATHHLPLVVLGQARQSGRLLAPLIGVVTDYTAHACWAEAGVDGFAVPCREAADELAGHGVDAARIAITGIPVRPAFDRIEPVMAPEPGEPLRVLVTSGGFGVGPLRRIVSSFAGIPDVALTVVCGRAKHVARRISRDVRRRGLRAEILGFERNMPARVAAAHVVVGKAGGLTVSETLTAGRPMIVVGAVPGNEELNEAFVVCGGAGIAAPPHRVGELLRRLQGNGILPDMAARARSLVVPRAAHHIVSLAMATADNFRLLGAGRQKVELLPHRAIEAVDESKGITHRWQARYAS
jgi:processive 1,2-diacylglycerol beta-glucosyltransferase